MTIRLRYKIDCAISSTTAEDRDLGNTKSEVVVDSQGEGGTRKFNLAGGVTDVQVCLGDVTTAKYLHIKTTPQNQNDSCADVKVRFNSPTGEQRTISAIAPSKEGHFLVTEAGITSLYATNVGTTGMSLTVSVAGD